MKVQVLLFTQVKNEVNKYKKHRPGSSGGRSFNCCAEGQHYETLINSFYFIKEKLFISLVIPKEQNSNLYNKVMMIILTAVECLHEMSQQMQNMKTESQIKTCVQTRLTKLSRLLKMNMGNNLSLLNIEYLILL